MNKVKVKKKLGRPRINDNTNTYKAPKYPEVAPTKFMGWCGTCMGIITKKDLISIRVYICPSCGKKAQLNKLKKDKVFEKHNSKQEYLRDTLQIDYKNHCENNGSGSSDHIKNIRIAE